MTERDIFLAVLDLPGPAARDRFLRQACGPDAALRGRVEGLLRSHAEAGDFLGEPAVLPPDPSHAPTRAFVPTPDGAEAGRDRPEADPDPLTFLGPPGQPDSLGRLGRYEVLEVLGRGGFGIVLRAFDESLRRVVAVKVLAPHLAATSPARKRFLREARASAQVRHENVVQVYEVGEQPLPHLVMEFIPGETLQQRLDRTGPLDVAEVLRVGRQLADGLAAAHAHGLVHRDVKPANVLLEGGPRVHVKLTDFGLARAADDASLTQSGQVAGTPMYMAPEQAQGEPVDPRADLFSLGSVLYVMTTGRPPFRARGALAVLKRVAEDAPRPIWEIIPETPDWLCDLIARLHAKDPADRFQTAREVADLLAHHLDRVEHPGPAEPPPAPTTTRRPERRRADATALRRPRTRTRRWAAFAAVLVVVVGGLGFTEAAGVTDVRGTVVRLISPEGTLVVEVDDPGVSVKIDGSDLVITGAGVQEIRLKAGRYTVEAVKDGKLVRQELVTVERNGRRVVRVSQEPAEAGAAGDRHRPPTGPLADAEVRRVAALPAAEQVEAVRAELKRRNPGFDGTLTPAVEDGVVAGLRLSADAVADLSPVRALTRLRVLRVQGSEPGKGLLADLAPLAGLRLATLDCPNTRVADLAPLRGMPLQQLYVQHTSVRDLAPLKGLPLVHLNCSDTPVADLSPLAGMPLDSLYLDATGVADLTPLAGMPLKSLHLRGYRPRPDRDRDILRSLARLEEIDGRPPAEFWKAAGLGVAPADAAAWERGVADLPAVEQVKAVARRLQELNPGFDGAVESTVENGAVRGLAFSADHVLDLSPVRALPGLRSLACSGSDAFKGQLVEEANGTVKVRAAGKTGLSDLSPLKGLPLTTLSCVNSNVYDLTPLRGMKLTTLQVGSSLVYDLAPLAGMPLAELDCGYTKVADLAPLRGMGLARLFLDGTPAADLSPLKGMPLTHLGVGPAVTDLSPLKGMPLNEFGCGGSGVTDLSPLAGMPLGILSIADSKVTDLSPLKGMTTLKRLYSSEVAADLSPLKGLSLEYLHAGERVTDLSPLKGMPLDTFQFAAFKADRDAAALRAITTLNTINDKPAAEFWRDIEQK